MVMPLYFALNPPDSMSGPSPRVEKEMWLVERAFGAKYCGNAESEQMLDPVPPLLALLLNVICVPVTWNDATAVVRNRMDPVVEPDGVNLSNREVVLASAAPNTQDCLSGGASPPYQFAASDQFADVPAPVHS